MSGRVELEETRARLLQRRAEPEWMGVQAESEKRKPEEARDQFLLGQREWEWMEKLGEDDRGHGRGVPVSGGCPVPDTLNGGDNPDKNLRKPRTRCVWTHF